MTVKGLFVNATDHRDFATGETIFREGDQGDEMFGVVSGKVELRHGDEVVITLEPNSTFGEMAIISDSRRSLTAVAAEASSIAVINRRTFLFLVHETPTFALDVMRSLADRIRDHDRQR